MLFMDLVDNNNKLIKVMGEIVILQRVTNLSTLKMKIATIQGKIMLDMAGIKEIVILTITAKISIILITVNNK